MQTVFTTIWTRVADSIFSDVYRYAKLVGSFVGLLAREMGVGQQSNQLKKASKLFIGWLVGRLVEFYGISTFVGYLIQNPFILTNRSISNNSV